MRKIEDNEKSGKEDLVIESKEHVKKKVSKTKNLIS
jgi:hypothetical protein